MFQTVAAPRESRERREPLSPGASRGDGEAAVTEVEGNQETQGGRFQEGRWDQPGQMLLAGG